jgi:hypothetical protein
MDSAPSRFMFTVEISLISIVWILRSLHGTVPAGTTYAFNSIVWIHMTSMTWISGSAKNLSIPLYGFLPPELKARLKELADKLSIPLYGFNE